MGNFMLHLRFVGHDLRSTDELRVLGSGLKLQVQRPVVSALYRLKHWWPPLIPSSLFESFHWPAVCGLSPALRRWVASHNSLPRCTGVTADEPAFHGLTLEIH
ncbi:hypothetical protein HAX54_027574 [Datura stramonium]|uniref:Uncharacterized protein n=1 Tax=Datura stramonium TaxID=4076 RepID=A0ABS8V3J0_DATST|nr:hypothetical protein [Datura stramonium]